MQIRGFKIKFYISLLKYDSMSNTRSVFGENNAKNIKRICRDKFKYIMCLITFSFRFTSSWGLITCQYIHKKS